MHTCSDAPIAYVAGGESRIVEFRGGVVANKRDGKGDRSVAWQDEGGGAYLISAPGRWRVSNLRPVVERVPLGWLALSTGAAWA